MQAETIAGWVAMGVTLTYCFLGLPAQIIKNYQARSTSGLSLLLMSLSFLTFTSWVVYSALRTPTDWFIAISNSPGSFFVGVILLQFWIYRRRN